MVPSVTIATSLISSHGQFILSPFLLRETERDRETEKEERMKREKTLLTQRPVFLLAKMYMADYLGTCSC